MDNLPSIILYVDIYPALYHIYIYLSPTMRLLLSVGSAQTIGVQQQTKGFSVQGFGFGVYVCI